MFEIWKKDMSGTVAYVGKNGISEVKVKSAFVKLVYIYMIDTHHSTSSPSYNVIAEDTGLSRSIVIRCVKVLEEKGLLNKQVRPTETLYHKSNVYTIHQPISGSSSVQDTPSSLKDLKPSISIEDHNSNFNKINSKWHECFGRNIGLGEFMTLSRQSDMEYLVQQIETIQNNHYDVTTIVDAGKYVYRCIQRGGFEAMNKKQYTPPTRSTYRQQKATVKGLTRAEKERGTRSPKYSEEEFAARKNRINEKLNLMREQQEKRTCCI